MPLVLNPGYHDIPPFHGHHYFLVFLGYSVKPTGLTHNLGAININLGQQQPVAVSDAYCWYCDKRYHPDITNQPCGGPQ